MKEMKSPPAERPSPPKDGGPMDEVEQKFVGLWRSMSSLWGISPTMAEVHGLLFITGAALSMDDIMARLEISRGNVSMNLSKLAEWGLVRRGPKRGGRRGPYPSPRGAWGGVSPVAAPRQRPARGPPPY